MWYFIIFVFWLLIRYFQLVKVFRTNFQENSFFDEIFSVIMVVLFSLFLKYWILFDEIRIRNLSKTAIMSVVGIASVIIFYLLKLIVLRINKISKIIKKRIIIFSFILEIILMMIFFS